MKRYELKYTKGEKGVFMMSTVANPATKTQLVMFDDEKKLLEFQDDEKQVIYSVAMRPNVLIPRKDINGEPALVFYTEETADDLLQNFFKNGSNLGATINHDKNIRKDMYIFEAWKVLDPEKDKATLLGMSVEKGDIIMGQKIDNPEIWADVKSGKLTGFSIEAYLEPILLTKNKIEMTQDEIDARIKIVLMETEEEKKKLEEEEAEKKKLADEEAAKLAMVTEPTEEPTEPAPDLQKIIDEKDAEINDLKAKLAEVEGKHMEMSTQIVELEEDLKKGIKPNPDKSPAKKLEEMTGYEKMQFNKLRNR